MILTVSALRVHISPATKLILDQLGGYNVAERGEVFLKVNQCYNST